MAEAMGLILTRTFTEFFCLLCLSILRQLVLVCLRHKFLFVRKFIAFHFPFSLYHFLLSNQMVSFPLVCRLEQVPNIPWLQRVQSVLLPNVERKMTIYLPYLRLFLLC